MQTLDLADFSPRTCFILTISGHASAVIQIRDRGCSCAATTTPSATPRSIYMIIALVVFSSCTCCSGCAPGWAIVEDQAPGLARPVGDPAGPWAVRVRADARRARRPSAEAPPSLKLVSPTPSVKVFIRSTRC
jgi:hypothetical protein